MTLPVIGHGDDLVVVSRNYRPVPMSKGQQHIPRPLNQGYLVNCSQVSSDVYEYMQSMNYTKLGRRKGRTAEEFLRFIS